MGRGIRLVSPPHVYGGVTGIRLAHLSSAMEVRREKTSYANAAEATRGVLVGFGMPNLMASRVADAVRMAGQYVFGRTERPCYWVVLRTDDVGATVVVTDSEELPVADGPEWHPARSENPGSAKSGLLRVHKTPDGYLWVGCLIRWSTVSSNGQS